jgi:Fungal specific transcription factor domain
MREPSSSDSTQVSSRSPARPVSPELPSPVLQEQAPPPLLLPLSSEMVHLLNEFRQGMATWMDIFDHTCTYQREVCRLGLTSELLLRCICAFTAKRLCLLPFGEIWMPIATKYYSESLSLLIKQLNDPESNDVALTAVILLSSYEILAAHGQAHRRHCEGAMKLMRMQGISARSLHLDRANFWIWIRHDITVAIMNETSLQMSPKEWNVSWREGETQEDLLGNQLLWLVGRAVDWTYGSRTPHENNEILQDAEQWYTGLSVSFRGVKYGDSVEDGLSKVHFAVSAAGEFSPLFVAPDAFLCLRGSSYMTSVLVLHAAYL